MTVNQIQERCKPLAEPFWFALHDGSFLKCSGVISLDSATVNFVSDSVEPICLFLGQIKDCVQYPIQKQDAEPGAALDRRKDGVK